MAASSGVSSCSNVGCLPHRGQNVHAATAADRNRGGVPSVNRKVDRKTLNHVTNGAPVVRRQIQQLQLVRFVGVPPAS